MKLESKVKNYSQYIKIIAGVVFSIAIAMAILKKPELPEDYKKNVQTASFVTYGGEAAETGWDVLEVSDGYLMLGDTASFTAGSTDIYLVKTDKKGSLMWSRSYGDEFKNNGVEIVRADDGFIIAGGTGTEDGDSDIYVIKIDNTGDVVWERTFGGANYDFAYSIKRTAQGNYIIAGYSSSFNDIRNSDAYLLLIDEKGEIIWEKLFGGFNWEIAYDAKQLKDGGYILSGYTDSFGSGSTDFYIVRTDADGNSLWSKTFGGKRHDRAFSIIETKDGGFFIAGKTTSYISKGIGWDMYNIKTDSSGRMEWDMLLPASEVDVGNSVIETSDGYIIAGSKKCYGICTSDIYVIKADADGNTVWWNIYAGEREDRASAIIGNDEKGYTIVGTTLSQGNGRGDAFLLKIDKDGKQEW